MADTITIENAEVLKDTGRAILVEAVDYLDDPIWIPKSVVHEDSEVWSDSLDGSGPGDLVVKRWWAEKEGLD